MRGRFDFMDAKAACDAGEIGDLFMAEAHYVHDLRPVYLRTPWRTRMPQDLILGGACHPIDLLRWFMGDIEEVPLLRTPGRIGAGLSAGGQFRHQRPIHQRPNRAHRQFSGGGAPSRGSDEQPRPSTAPVEPSSMGRSG